MFAAEPAATLYRSRPPRRRAAAAGLLVLLVVALAAARGLDRIVPGAADGSFGPVVGVLAGVPFAVAVFAHLAGRTGAADRRAAERSEGPVAT